MQHQMSFFEEPEKEQPEAEQQPEPKAEPISDGVIDPGPVQCESRCRQIATHYVGFSHLVCEKHAKRWMDVKDNGKVPPTQYCPDGFNSIRVNGRVEHRVLGKVERVQKCSDRKCGAIFTICPHWTREPILCPECRNEVWERYKDEEKED